MDSHCASIHGVRANFVKTNIKRVQNHPQSQTAEDDHDSDNGVRYDSQQPD